MEPAIDITLIGRYYERYADHAVSVARQTIFLVTGEPAPLPTSITSGATETALGV
jgi:phosphate transport system protein